MNPIEQIKTEIERRIAILDKELKPAAEEDFVSSWASTANNKKVALQSILSFIISLQQEQNVKSYCREHCQGYKDTGGKCFFEWNCPAIKQQEQPLTIEKVVEQCKKFGGNPEVIQPELDVDTLREWSMRYAPDIRSAIEATAYHFWNKALNAGKEEVK